MSTLPRNLARFYTETLRSMPRPATYLDELAACAESVVDGVWEFDEDAACFKTLRAKYADYRPTKDDLFRVQLFHAELRALRDELTRALWAELHQFCLTAGASDPATLAAYVQDFTSRVPCGDCRTHWATVLAEEPPDATDPFGWSVRAHNAVNRKLGRREFTVAEAQARWTTG